MDIGSMKAVELRAELDRRGQDSRGHKDVLKERLSEALKEEALARKLDSTGAADAAVAQAVDEVVPEDSISHAVHPQYPRSASSRAGSHVSLLSAKAQESAKRAALQVRLQFLDEQQKAEREEKEAKDRRDTLELRTAIAEARAREEVLSQALSMAPVANQEAALTARSAVAAATHEPACPPRAPAVASHELAEPAGCQDLLVKKLLTASLLPKPDVPIFSGDVTRYHQFIRAFDNRVGSILSDDVSKLFYLEQYTSGSVRDMVSSCTHMKSGGYQEARRILDHKFGNPSKVVDNIVQRLTDWPPIRSDDVSSLEKLSIEVRTAHNSVSSLTSGQSELDHPRSIKGILEKVPFPIQDRWRRVVDRIVEKERRQVRFLDLVKYIEDEARIASHSIYGRQVMAKKQQRTEDMDRRTRVVSNTVMASDRRSKQACTFCSQQHALSNCKDYQQLTLDERRQFVFDRNLCFGSLSQGHISRQCTHRLTCEVCNGRHPTVLHIFRSTGQPAGSQGSPPPTAGVVESKQASPPAVAGNVLSASCKSSSLTGTVKMPIVPVKVRSCGGSVVEAYAFLDSGSNSSFCSYDLLQQLGIAPQKKTQLMVTTMAKESTLVPTSIVNGLTVGDLDENHWLKLPEMFALDKIPVSKEELCRQRDVGAWPHLQGIIPPEIDAEVGLLIGVNVPEALAPIDFIPSCDNGPFAVRTRLGWVVNGPVRFQRLVEMKATANRIRLEMQNQHDESLASDERGWSVEDFRWMEIIESGCSMKGGHYELPIPLKSKDTVLPDNREVCNRRLQGLKKKFQDQDFADRYREVADDMSEKGYAERVTAENIDRNDGLVNYIPHHGVFGKKEKLRVVFDCSSSFRGVSLNDSVLQGPSLTNPLIDILIRFREDEVAFMGDVNAMFHQVLVPPEQRDLLRFLWWRDGDTSQEVETWRMTVHPFGLCSSPSCASYALRRTALDFGEEFTTQASQTILDNVYVDDLIKSVPSVDEAINLVQEVRELCIRGGFHLAKFVSNNREVLESIPSEDRGKQVKDLDLDVDLPSEKALGVQWLVEPDVIVFVVSEIPDKPCTRRGMLSVIGSMYDPLGMAAVYVVCGRIVLQELTRRQYGWDDPAPDDIRAQWDLWLGGVLKLSTIGIPRCVKPVGFGTVQSCELHHFSDASSVAYGTVSYLRLIRGDGLVHCAFVFGKARVLPLKGNLTIPRAELTAATLSARIDVILRRALQIPIGESTFWTDSTTVIRYIRNETTRFHTFVSNRLAVIRDVSSPDQWRYVDSAQNPADDASRGQLADKCIANTRWFNAPAFLWKEREEWPDMPAGFDGGTESDPEVKIVSAAVVSEGPDPLEVMFSHYSRWYSLVHAVAWILRLKRILLHRCRERSGSGSVPELHSESRLTVADLEAAEAAIITSVQKSAFAIELKSLERDGAVRISSPLARLDPFLSDGIIRVGGRLSNSPIHHDQRNPPILPKGHHVVDLIIQSAHEEVGHSGREHVLASLRSRYWLLSGNSAVRRVLRHCLSCRRRQGPLLSQKMADLPADRVAPDEPPFTSTGLDLFGPFYVKRGRGQEKRYGVVFSCLVSRAVHIEVVASLSTDSFLCALRRFLARRGQVKRIRSDRGTNFVGASNELSAEWEELMKNEVVIHGFMLQKKVDWIFNVPEASSHGGVWERVIRTIRKVLDALLSEQVFTEETLTTLLCEVEAVINSRPLTYVSGDKGDPDPLTPNDLLLAGGAVSVPAGVFRAEDLYSKRRWKQAQYLADLFWLRWRKEYVPLLQSRQKSIRPERSLLVGDVVLVTDKDLPRCHWPLGRVIEVAAGSDGLVRSVKLRVRGSEMCRPVTKLVLLCENDGSEV